MSKEEQNQAMKAKERPCRSALGRILNTIGVLLMALVLAACLSLVIPKLIGYEPYVVVSGSMEPAIPVRSIVYSKKVDPATLQAGDIIVFIDPARGTTPITHRVVSNDPDTGTVITKGDANKHEDTAPATYDNIIGKVDAHIPRVGFAAAMLTSTLGKIVAGLIMLEAWLLIEIGRRRKAE